MVAYTSAQILVVQDVKIEAKRVPQRPATIQGQNKDSFQTSGNIHTSQSVNLLASIIKPVNPSNPLILTIFDGRGNPIVVDTFAPHMCMFKPPATVQCKTLFALNQAAKPMDGAIGELYIKLIKNYPADTAQGIIATSVYSFKWKGTHRDINLWNTIFPGFTANFADPSNPTFSKQGNPLFNCKFTNTQAVSCV